ncbi:MAG: AAC(3) family N-acetyltransferase [Acidobacteriota bacterium]
MYSRAELADGFRALGIAPGDTVMVHASVRSVGEVAGGPDQIHLALKDALTDQGTLMMYASCPSYYDEVDRGNLTADQEREVREKLPAFDPLTARSARDNGALVELLRTYPGSIVNPHVARFVVWGRHAGLLLSHQPWSYALGSGSALDRFMQLDGRILLLGSDHDATTFLHYAEHIVEIPANAWRGTRCRSARMADESGATWKSSTPRTRAPIPTGPCGSLRAWWTRISRAPTIAEGLSGRHRPCSSTLADYTSSPCA